MFKEKRSNHNERGRYSSNTRPTGQPSRVISSKFAEMEGAEQTEIAAQITVPTDGGWGWVVLMASFGCCFILDGCVLTFGALLKDVSTDLQVGDATTAVVNSIQFALYLMLSPIVSALINRFGFRTCGMVGSIICCYSALGASLSKGIASFFFLYGLSYGLGSCFVNMVANLIVGFYFEKYRTQAMVFVTVGSSFGIMLMFPVNLVLVEEAGWRSTVLLHSGLLGLIFFLSLTFKPLLSLTVTKLDEAESEPTRTVTFLPTVAGSKAAGGRQAQASTTERIFGAVSNVRFPTAAAVIHDENSPTSAAQSQKPAVSRIKLTSTQGVSKAQLNQVKSMISKGAVRDQPPVEIQVKVVEPQKKKSCWARLCDWEGNSASARPMYRDDAFYDGNLQKLPQYPSGDTTGLDYQMAVSRAITVNDLQDQRGVLTTAVKRILVTMCDVELLKKKSFLFYCLSGVAGYMGLNIPYIYLQDRNLEAGVDATHCTYFVSVIGLANAFGRMVWSFVGMKVTPLTIYIIGVFFAGLSTALSDISYNPFYQYIYCFVFGFCVCVTSSVRSLIIVDLYGLERLTNGTGLLLLFMGVGNMFGTPIAGVLKDTIGYSVAFYFSGGLLMLSSVLGVFVSLIYKTEKKKSAPKQHSTVEKYEGKHRTSKDIKIKSEGIDALALPKQIETKLSTQYTPMQPKQVTQTKQHKTDVQNMLLTQSVPGTQSMPVILSTIIMQPMTSTQSKRIMQSTSVTLDTTEMEFMQSLPMSEEYQLNSNSN